MSERVGQRSMGRTVGGLALLLIGFVGMAAAFVGGLGIFTDDLSCAYSPRCQTNLLFVLVGVAAAFLGLIIGFASLRTKPIEALPAPQPIVGVVQRPTGPPAWAVICGALALGVTLVCGFLALNWLLAYLADASNPFSGLALLLAVGAGIVATGFLILGIMLFAKKQ